MTTDSELETMRLYLESLVQKAQREQVAREKLDFDETNYITNPYKDEALHDRLKKTLAEARREWKLAQKLCILATNEAHSFLYKDG